MLLLLEEFLQRDVLSLLQPVYHVLLMDSASIYPSPAIVQLCRHFGIHLEYLPLYLPDYNPIEKSFKVLESWIKKNSNQQDEWYEFKYFVEYAVQSACYSVDWRTWYRKCRLSGVDNDDWI
jgi:transposase